MKTRTKGVADKRMTKSLTHFQVKASNDAARTFTGLASTWELDEGNDVIHPGAFKRTLDLWKRSGKVVPLIDMHNYSSVRMVVGKMLDAQETADGLECTFEVIEGPDGDEVYRRIKGGFVDGLSIGYRAVKYEIEEGESGDYFDRIRHLNEIELNEVSVVIWGMNENALIDTSSVKALLRSARRDGHDDEEKTRIRAELVKFRNEIDALLGETPKNDDSTEEPAAPASEAPDMLAIEAAWRDFELSQLATR